MRRAQRERRARGERDLPIVSFAVRSHDACTYLHDPVWKVVERAGVEQRVQMRQARGRVRAEPCGREERDAKDERVDRHEHLERVVE